MHNNGNIINATEVDTEEWLEMSTFSFVSFTTIKKKGMNYQQNTQSTQSLRIILKTEKSDRKEHTLYASNWPCTEEFAIAGMWTPEIQ